MHIEVQIHDNTMDFFSLFSEIMKTDGDIFSDRMYMYIEVMKMKLTSSQSAHAQLK